MRLFLFFFGLIGLGISCLQGIAPFIELARITALFLENLSDVFRAPWLFLSKILNFHISPTAIDLLNGVLSVFSYIVGFRRGELFLYRLMPFVAYVVIYSGNKKILFPMTAFLLVWGPHSLLAFMVY